VNANATAQETLSLCLRELRLPSIAARYADVASHAEREGWSFGQYLRTLCEIEVKDRSDRRVERLLKQSHLPPEKTRATLDEKRLPAPVAKQLAALCEGGFVERGENVLVFGLPGRGKSHLVCAIAHELVRQRREVLFTQTYKLVQQLLLAKRTLSLERELRRLDHFDVVILDDIGYVQQDRDEMEVLFTFLAERYERRSVMITSNLVFSQWDRIFKDAMTTAAAIDRLVHHSVILEMNCGSFREEHAKSRQGRTTTTLARATTNNQAKKATAGEI
jgi:DNA replication protein DnaC